jgi:hypothetical protein
MSQTSQSRRRCSPTRRSADNSSPIKPTMLAPFAKGGRSSRDVQIRRGPPAQRLKSIHELRFWELPCAAQDFGAPANIGTLSAENFRRPTNPRTREMRLKSLTARSTLPLDRDPRGTTETLCPDRPIGHVAVMLDFADLAGHLRPVSVR